MSLPWRIPSDDTPERETLSRELGLEPLVAGLLTRRGIATPEAAATFLRPRLEDLHDPFRLRGMEAAVTLLADALRDGRRIVVSGDYDVDGITSSALLGQFLRDAGCRELELFIPNRFEHGYGLTPRTVEALLALRPEVVVTVDNGITAIEEVARLRAAGIATVITDHHLPRPHGIPDGVVVNPQQPGCDYPFKGISGCGVAFKLAMALRKALRERGWWNDDRPEPNLKALLDLVAVATVADVVPLVGENRALVWHGLQMMNNGGVRPGLAALLARGRAEPVTARTLAFRVGPRINAAGRMAEGRLAADLLLSGDPGATARLAERLEAENDARRAKGEAMLTEALSLIEAEGLADGAGIVVQGTGFHEGIIGITAAKLVERYHRPVLVLAENGDSFKGSARSVPGINVTAALTECADLLAEYGGHAAAAGCKVPKAHLPDFRAQFVAACDRLAADAEPPALELDGRIDPGTVSDRLVEQILALEPFGRDNEEPRFVVAQAALPEGRPFGRGHLRWPLPGGGDMVAWGAAETGDPPPAAEYSVRVGFNTYRGERKPRLTVEDVRAGE